MTKLLKLFAIGIMAGTFSLFSCITAPFGSDIEAIIFDCDGVLVDTEYLKFLAWQEALASKNIAFSIEEYMPVVGHTSKNVLLMLKKLKGIDIPEDVIGLRTRIYHELQKKGVAPIQEMIEFVRRLSDGKHKLGLASSASKEEIMQNLTQIGLTEVFDVIVSGSDDLDGYIDNEGKNKPKPYIYIEAAKRLGVDPSRCLVFEDTQAGIEAASGAGMIAIAVPNQYTAGQDFSKAAKVFWTHSDLVSLTP